MSSFPNPWNNRKGPWITPAVSFSIINKEVNLALFESRGSLPVSTFVLTLPLYVGKVPYMSQKLSVLIQKLVPKYWDIASASWLETGCKILRLNETECSVSCSNLGIFAVEYNAELFVCGDGVRSLTESCDDWNNVNGDGCNSLCQVEDGWICRKGNYPAEKLGFDICERVPCYAPFNCRSQGVCLSDDACFCDTGYFGITCNETLPVFIQIGLNHTWNQLPSILNAVDANTKETLFTLIIMRGGNNLTLNVNGSSVAAKIVVYKSETFTKPIVRLSNSSIYGQKSIPVVEFKSVFLSNIFEIRLATAGSIIVNATGRMFVALNVSLPQPFLNFSLSNTNVRSLKNGANVSIQINVCKYILSQKLWQPVQEPIHTAISERQIVYEFIADSPNYYALIATSRIDAIRADAPVTPAELQLVEPEQFNIAAIAAGIAGGLCLIAAIYIMWYLRRRNRQRLVLAAYYQATVAAARKHKLKVDANAKNPQSFPNPPGSGLAGPRKNYQKTILQQPKEVVALDQSPPPPPQEFSADKSLVAAAIRSKFKNAHRFKRSLPSINLEQDLEFELASTQDSGCFISSNTSVDEVFETFGDAIEVESVDSNGNGERYLDSSSSCSAISMAEKSDGSDLEDAGIVPPVMLPLNDFEDNEDEVNHYSEVERAPLKLKSEGRRRRPSQAASYVNDPTSTLPTDAFSSVQQSVPYDTNSLPLASSSILRLQPSSSLPRQDAALRSKLWKQSNSNSFDA
jgi:cysteine-rich repeat protein